MHTVMYYKAKSILPGQERAGALNVEAHHLCVDLLLLGPFKTLSLLVFLPVAVSNYALMQFTPIQIVLSSPTGRTYSHTKPA